MGSLKYKKILFLLLLVFFPIAAYINGMNGEFTQLDDRAGIVENQNIGNYPSSYSTFNLTNVINTFIYNTFGLNSRAFHMKSLILHVVNVFLVFFIFKQIKDKKLAYITALLYSVHPATSEAVLWISGSVYLYNAFFTFLTIFLYLKSKSNYSYIFASSFVYILFLILTRNPWAVTVPILIFVIDYFLYKVDFKKYIYYLLPFLVYVVLYIPGAYFFRDSLIDTYSTNYNTPNLVYVKAEVIKRAVGLMLFPINLSVFSKGVLLTNPMNFIFALVIVLVFIAFVFYALKSKNIYLGMLLAVFASITPSLLPVELSANGGERYFYIGTAFFCFTLSIALVRAKRDVTISLLLFVLMLYFGRTFIRTFDWKTDKVLWENTQKVVANNYKVYINLGNVYLKEEDPNKAVENYKRAVALNPAAVAALYNLAHVYYAVGQYDVSRAYLNEVFKYSPNLPQAHVLLQQLNSN